MKSWVKIIGKSYHECPEKSLFMVTNVLFYFLLAIIYPEHTIPLKTIIDRWFAIVAKDGLFRLSIVTSPQWICDVMRMWRSGIVTSYWSIVPARANWRKVDLHKWITTVNIDFSLPGIHNLACKKALLPSFSTKQIIKYRERSAFITWIRLQNI